MKRVVAVVVLSFTALIAEGQEACTHPKIVKTTGTAELKVTPDQAVIQLGVDRQSATAKNAKTVVANTSRKVQAALKGLGIDDKDIQTEVLISAADDRLPKRPAHYELYRRTVLVGKGS